jgi:hypothetical protein
MPHHKTAAQLPDSFLLFDNEQSARPGLIAGTDSQTPLWCWTESWKSKVLGLLLITTLLTGSMGADPLPSHVIYHKAEWRSHELCDTAINPYACRHGWMPTSGSIRSVAAVDPDGGLEAKAAATFAWYLRSWSGPNDQALTWLDRAYEERIDYYGKLTSKPKVMEEKKRFAERWPVRAYVARTHSTTVGCDLDSGQCTITGIIDWDCRSEVRGARSTGSANLTLKIQLTGGRETAPVTRIIGENGSVISRVTGQ